MLEGLAMGSTLADQQFAITPLGRHKTTAPKPSTTGVYLLQSTSDRFQSEDKPIGLVRRFVKHRSLDCKWGILKQKEKEDAISSARG